MSSARDPGLHLLADLHGGPHLADASRIETALRAAAYAAGARVVGAMFHPFGPGAGVTGVLLLAESHISIHTWPEHGFAAVDIFLCGRADARAALDAIVAGLETTGAEVTEIARGRQPAI